MKDSSMLPLLLLLLFLVFPTLLIRLVRAEVALGTDRWAAVLLDYCSSDNVSDGSCDERRSRETMEELVVSSPHSPVAFLKAASYDRFTIDMDLYGWISLDGTNLPDGCFPSSLSDVFQALVAEDPGIVFSDYDGFLVLVRSPNRGVDGFACVEGRAVGFASEERNTGTAQGTVDTRFVYASESTFYPNTYARITSSTSVHEMLHSYGLQQSNRLDCGDEILLYDGDGCSPQAYGDSFAIMGLRQFASHPNPVK